MPNQARRTKPALMHQFLIILAETDPLVWRRIQVPERYSFWDLHVAIQDAMGWQDLHLHEFTVPVEGGGSRRIGIPDSEMPDPLPCEAGWKALVTAALGRRPLPFRYVYDFGDNWEHVLVHEGTWNAEPDMIYPRCLSGEHACPPEDCGGPSGYAEFLAAMRDRRHPQHEELLEWAGGHFHPDEFDPDQVTFENPKIRWKRTFGGE